MNLAQVGLMIAEIVVVSVLILAGFRVRRHLGLVPVYTLLGVVFYTCNVLAASVYVQLAPGFIVSPGTVAFFPTIIFVVLCVYITEDAIEARKLIYGLLVTNVFVVALGWATALHLTLPGALNSYHLVPGMFTANLRVTTVSMAAIFADTILIIVVYELVSRYTPILLFRIFLATALVLAADTLVFITGAYVDSPEYFTILRSALIGKTLAAALYAVIYTIYLHYLDDVEPASSSAGSRGTAAIFRALTYRQKYELLQARTARDPLTGLYNRGFFEEILASLTASALRMHKPLSILMLDIDHFKVVNDTFGHPTGDGALAALAAVLATSFRASDYVCRYGGEEFVVLLPSTDLPDAAALAEKTRARVAEHAIAGMHLTVTIGVAVFPLESASPQGLVQLADRRLYEGKRAGRDRVVAGAASDMMSQLT